MVVKLIVGEDIVVYVWEAALLIETNLEKIEDFESDVFVLFGYGVETLFSTVLVAGVESPFMVGSNIVLFVGKTSVELECVLLEITLISELLRMFILVVVKSLPTVGEIRLVETK